jgi:3-hydroxyisobutyrate dehydrogenase
MARIGFVGLGNMGWPMFQNLVKAGHSVKGFDIAPDAARKVATVGSQPAGSIGEACGAEIIISMLPRGQQVKEVYLGTSGILEAAKRGTLLIDCSTIDIDNARSVAAEAEAAALKCLMRRFLVVSGARRPAR